MGTSRLSVATLDTFNVLRSRIDAYLMFSVMQRRGEKSGCYK